MHANYVSNLRGGPRVACPSGPLRKITIPMGQGSPSASEGDHTMVQLCWCGPLVGDPWPLDTVPEGGAKPNLLGGRGGAFGASQQIFGFAGLASKAAPPLGHRPIGSFANLHKLVHLNTLLGVATYVYCVASDICALTLQGSPKQTRPCVGSKRQH